MRVHGSVLFYVHRSHKAHKDGEPRTAKSTFTQLLNSDWTLCYVRSLSTQAFRKALTPFGGQLGEDKERVRLQWRNQFWQSFGGSCRKAVLGVGLKKKKKKRKAETGDLSLSNYTSMRTTT